MRGFLWIFLAIAFLQGSHALGAASHFENRQPTIAIYPTISPYGRWQFAVHTENYFGESEITLSDGTEKARSYGYTYSFDGSYRPNERTVVAMQFGKTRIIPLPFDIQLVGQYDLQKWSKSKISGSAMLGFGRAGASLLFSRTLSQWKKDRVEWFTAVQLINGYRDYEEVVNSARQNEISVVSTRLLPMVGFNYNVVRPSGRGYEISLFAGWERTIHSKVDDEDFPSDFVQRDGLFQGLNFAVNFN